jgi:hypothetical protein
MQLNGLNNDDKTPNILNKRTNFIKNLFLSIICYWVFVLHLQLLYIIIITLYNYNYYIIIRTDGSSVGKIMPYRMHTVYVRIDVKRTGVLNLNSFDPQNDM